MKKFITILSLFVATIASAADFSILGSGTTPVNSSAANTAFATAVRLETFLTDAISAGVVQSFGVATDAAKFNSEVFGAYNVNYSIFGVKNTVFAGGAVNLGYGQAEQASWAGGPLLGNRLFLTDNIYVLAQANYDFAISPAANNALRYSLGLAFRF